MQEEGGRGGGDRLRAATYSIVSQRHHLQKLSTTTNLNETDGQQQYSMGLQNHELMRSALVYHNPFQRADIDSSQEEQHPTHKTNIIIIDNNNYDPQPPSIQRKRKLRPIIPKPQVPPSPSTSSSATHTRRHPSNNNDKNNNINHSPPPEKQLPPLLTQSRSKPQQPITPQQQLIPRSMPLPLPPAYYEDVPTPSDPLGWLPCVIEDATKPFVIARPVRIPFFPGWGTIPIAANHAALTIAGYYRIEELSTGVDEALAFDEESHKVNVEARQVVGKYLRNSKDGVSPIIRGFLRLRRKEDGGVVEVAMREQLFYSDTGEPSFLFCVFDSVRLVTKTQTETLFTGSPPCATTLPTTTTTPSSSPPLPHSPQHQHHQHYTPEHVLPYIPPTPPTGKRHRDTPVQKQHSQHPQQHPQQHLHQHPQPQSRPQHPRQQKMGEETNEETRWKKRRRKEEKGKQRWMLPAPAPEPLTLLFPNSDMLWEDGGMQAVNTAIAK